MELCRAVFLGVGCFSCFPPEYGRLRAILHIKLAENVLDRQFDRSFAKTQFPRDKFIRHSHYQAVEYFHFTAAKIMNLGEIVIAMIGCDILKVIYELSWCDFLS